MLHRASGRAQLSSMLVAWLPAQEPPPAESYAATREQLVEATRRQLAADDLATVAWGAHAAAQYRLTECIPQLRAGLVASGPRSPDAARALLDALVETDAKVPSEELASFFSGWCHDSALMLLGRQPEANRRTLLQQYRALRPGSDARVACGCWLATIRDPAFLRELLEGPVTVEMLVGDGGDDLVQAIELGFASLSHHRPKVPAGFPPTPFRSFDLGDHQVGTSPDARRRRST